MIQSDFFESLLEKVKKRPLKPIKTPSLVKTADKFEFNGYPVEVMRRPYQRSIGVIVKPSGLIRVTAAKSTNSRAIWRFLKECEEWVEKTQTEYSQLRKKFPQKTYQAGEDFLFLGKAHRLQFFKAAKSKTKVVVNSSSLNVFLAQGESQSSQNISKEVLAYYKKQGRKVLQDRVTYWSQEMELYPKKVSYRSQKTRWGSCGSNGHISLNWKLVAAHLDVIDYVIIHELAHLKYQNHGKYFWALVAKYSPNHKSHRRWLSENQYEFDFLNKESELYLN